MNFKLRLSPEARLQLEAERTERLRLFGLADRWLALELMKLARQARTERPDVSREAPTYEATLLYYLPAELARRLGETRGDVSDIDWELRELSDYELRLRTGHTLSNVAAWAGGVAFGRLAAEACNGNPLVYAVDRLCPGKPNDAQDPLVRRLSEIARVRSVPFEGVWTPAFVQD